MKTIYKQFFGNFIIVKQREKKQNIREHILIHWKRLERYLNGDKKASEQI